MSIVVNVCCRRLTMRVSTASCTSTSTRRTCLKISTDISSCRSSSVHPRRRWLAAGQTATWSDLERQWTRRQRQQHTSHRHGYTVLPRSCTDWRRNCTTSEGPLNYPVDAVEQVHVYIGIRQLHCCTVKRIWTVGLQLSRLVDTTFVHNLETVKTYELNEIRSLALDHARFLRAGEFTSHDVQHHFTATCEVAEYA